MDLYELKRLVDDGKIFSVEFFKRSDGSLRKMVARTRVPPKVAGSSERAYDPDSYGLLLVYDLRARGYRTIPADNVVRVKSHGHETLTELAN